MSVITIPVIAATGPSGTLYELVDNSTNLNSEVSRTRSIDGLNLILDDTNASTEQKITVDETNILAILAAGGDIENYLFGIRQPGNSTINLDVPVGVPSRQFITQAVKSFSQWFANNADVWLNTVLDELLYFNQPNPSDGIILTASESELIRQIDTGTFSFLTVAEVQTLIQDTNWVKL